MQSNVTTTLQKITESLSKRDLEKGGRELTYGMELWLLTQVKSTEIAMSIFADLFFFILFII